MMTSIGGWQRGWKGRNFEFEESKRITLMTMMRERPRCHSMISSSWKVKLEKVLPFNSERERGMPCVSAYLRLSACADDDKITCDFDAF